jgi:hypothetical protein
MYQMFVDDDRRVLCRAVDWQYAFPVSDVRFPFRRGILLSAFTIAH